MKKGSIWLAERNAVLEDRNGKLKEYILGLEQLAETNALLKKCHAQQRDYITGLEQILRITTNWFEKVASRYQNGLEEQRGLLWLMKSVLILNLRNGDTKGSE